MPNKRNYTKSPVNISTLLPNILKPLRKKNGSRLLELKMNWEKILGKNLAKKCFVHSIRKINDKNILTLISNQNDLLEISYSSEEIKHKIKQKPIRNTNTKKQKNER